MARIRTRRQKNTHNPPLTPILYKNHPKERTDSTHRQLPETVQLKILLPRANTHTIGRNTVLRSFSF